MDVIKRDSKGKFLKGKIGGPGRPPGQTLKEFWRMKFQAMTPEEKEAFSEKVGLETIWKMAEGNPHNTGEQKQEIDFKQVLVKFINGAEND